MPTQTPVPLATLIEESLLLSDERKAELLKVLPTLKPNEEDALRALLASQESIIANIVTHAITKAVAENDSAFLESLDQFLHEAMKRLRKEEERAEQGEEGESVENLFDDAP